MARPDTTVYREPAQRQLTTWNPGRVRSALAQMQLGDYALAGALADAVLADDRAQAALGTRINGVLSLPLRFEAADDTPHAAQAAETLELDWWDIADEATLAEWMAYALLLGASLAELVWDTEGERVIPRLQVWHPSNVRRRGDEWQIRQAPDKWTGITLGDGKWTLLTPFGPRRPGVRALLRALSIPWLSKQYAITDWNQYSELHGSGTRVGKAPAGATAAERRSFRDDLANLASDSVVVVPEGWGVELLEAKVGSGVAFEKLISWADKAIAVAILGQNLTTDVEGGSLAAAEVHERVRYDLVQADTEVLATTLHDDTVTWWAEFNVGRRELAPWPDWDSAPPSDEVSAATALSARAQALLTLATAQQTTGLPIDWPELAARLNIPLLESGRRADRHLATVRLASGDEVDSAKGFVRGQLYTDRLVDVTAGQAVTATRPMLDRVTEIIRDARDYDELRDTLLREYASLDVDELATLTESSLLLASLAGRLAVLGDDD